MGEAVSSQELGEVFRLVDRSGADKDRPAGGVDFFDVSHNLQQLCLIVAADDGCQPFANGGAVGRHHRNADIIGAGNLTSTGGNGAGHAGQMRPASEEVLDGDSSGVSPTSRLDFNALLGLDGLMQSVPPRPTLGDSAGELVDNDDLLA